MSPPNGELPRRTVLELIGGAAAGTAGLAAGSSGDPVTVNVGYAAASGREAALAAAEETVRVIDAIDALTIRLPGRAVDGLRDRPDIRYVEANGTMWLFGETEPWGIERIDADNVHREGHTGSGVEVAVIDSGVDSDHPDLQGNLGTGKAFYSCGSACRCPTGYCTGGNTNVCYELWDDDSDHGTHVAGILGAIDDTEGVVGVAPAVTLHAVKAFGPSGCGSYSDVADAITYVADQGWDVANMSFGGDHSSMVEDAVEYANGTGVLLVAGTGRNGPCTDCVRYPAAHPEVIAVTGSTPGGTLGEYSHTGPEVDLIAPGGADDNDDSTSIYSTVAGSYDYKVGTSMACPHVAGAGAQLIADGYSASGARTRLADTAENLGLSSNEQGSGLVDVAEALGVGIDVVTNDASSVKDTAAYLNGDLRDLGGASSVDVFFEWGASGTDLANETPEESKSSTGIFSHRITGLASGTTYEFRAVSHAPDEDRTTGSRRSFTTTGSSDGDGGGGA